MCVFVSNKRSSWKFPSSYSKEFKMSFIFNVWYILSIYTTYHMYSQHHFKSKKFLPFQNWDFISMNVNWAFFNISLTSNQDRAKLFSSFSFCYSRTHNFMHYSIKLVEYKIKYNERVDTQCFLCKWSMFIIAIEKSINCTQHCHTYRCKMKKLTLSNGKIYISFSFQFCLPSIIIIIIITKLSIWWYCVLSFLEQYKSFHMYIMYIQK